MTITIPNLQIMSFILQYEWHYIMQSHHDYDRMARQSFCNFHVCTSPILFINWLLFNCYKQYITYLIYSARRHVSGINIIKYFHAGINVALRGAYGRKLRLPLNTALKRATRRFFSPSTPGSPPEKSRPSQYSSNIVESGV